MLSTDVVLVTAIAYGALLFLLAFFSELWSSSGRGAGLLRSPLVYTLSISVYCTSWTFYGAVGSAARNGLEFMTIYLGPTLVFVGWWLLLRKLVRIGRVNRITSIADLISSRFGKSTALAVLVTVIAVLATTPYIALQLKAITTSYSIVSNTAEPSVLGERPLAHADLSTSFWVAVLLAIFTIAFGTRRLDANEHHPGVVAAIAFEALVKLFALLAVGAFVVFGVAGGLGEVFARPAASALLEEHSQFGARWMTLTLLSACAVVCLPRQFQVTVVENANENNLRMAGWLFPSYLILTCLFVLPIAVVGLSELPAQADPDLFVLTLPIAFDQDALALFVFIGGLSSATSMVIVASIALSTMISNHVVVPLALSLRWNAGGESGDIKNLLLISRRLSIAAIMLLGYLYFVFGARAGAPLASIGLIAFAGVAQFMPCLLAGLYWRHATARGAVVGLSAGLVLWIYTLLLPSFATEGSLFKEIVEHGPFGVGLLRPVALFGLDGMDSLLHALFWSLGANAVLLVIVSLFTEPSPIERLQGALFVDVFRNAHGSEPVAIHRSAAVEDLYVLAQRILGPDDAYHLFAEYARRQGLDDALPNADAGFIAHLERRLSGSIGAASARVMVSQVATGETITLDEVIRLVDETQQVLEYSQQLEQKSRELEETAEKLKLANEQLMTLDANKDDFLSQVSHEVRTPMTSIRSFSEILLSDQTLDPARTRRFIGIIHEESLRLTRLLDEILELSRLERGEMDLQLTEVEVEQVVDRALTLCRASAEQSGVVLRRGALAQRSVVQADPDRLCQVFINLFSNAIKYNVSARPWVEVACHAGEAGLVVLVRDNGPGIPEHDRERIFQKFSRGWSNSGAPTAGAQVGTGLGLAISRQIVRRLGGDLDLVADTGSGACFRVTLRWAGAPAAGPDVVGRTPSHPMPSSASAAD
ncbi:MAG: sodium:solute symporter [Gammaproteobacteria bacterium]|nr:sodium:solute symporter [Gammaproteobacteria bacterium]